MATIVIALLLIPSTHAATAAANSTEQKATWTPEPKGRGTWSIVSNCVFTLIICIWTVIHDDVLLYKVNREWSLRAKVKITPFSRLLSKVQWMLYAFMAPENVILSAYSQWKEARELQKQLCSIIGADILGLEGSFFVIMGGFSSGPIQGDGYYPSYLDKKGFISLIKEKGIPDSVNLRLIQDRGKADAIGKLLAVIQALSLVVQCLLRKIDGLTVTLLEFHVVIQVFCATLIYGFWWSKPQGVAEPIPIEHPATRFIQVSGERTDIDIHDQRFQDTEQATMIAPAVSVDTDTSRVHPRKISEILQHPPHPHLFSRPTVEEIRHRLRDWYKGPALSRFNRLYLFDRWNKDDFQLETIIYAVYGGLHSIAWNSSYPTPIEQLLWRISCISLIITPMCYAIFRRYYVRLPSPLDSQLDICLVFYNYLPIIPHD